LTYVTAPREAALGTYVELAVTDAAALPAAQALLHAELAVLDLACSRFRDDSELSAVNAGAGAPVAAGPVLREALRVALAAAATTGGLVDPTLGAELIAAGYDRDFAALPGGAPASEPLPARARRAGWPEVVVDDDAGTVTVPAGCRLDLGATGKAHGADRAAALIASRLGVGALVSLGGDVAMAGAPPRSGWPVRTSVRAGDAEAETVLVEGGGIATSSPFARRWRRGHQPMHHLIDPRTGGPARVAWRAVTVAAATAAEANALSTAAVVLAGDAPAWLAATGVPARLVGLNGRCHRLGGWPAPAAWSA
jgi:FAD:protein FMN transferase